MPKRKRLKKSVEDPFGEEEKSAPDEVKFLRKPPGDDEDRFHWRDASQHTLYFLLYIMDWNLMGVLISEDDMGTVHQEVSIVHYVLLIIVCAGPLIFLQTFIGQYTQNGCFCFGEMLPLMYGFGYTMITIAFFNYSIHIYYTCNIMDYLFVSLYNTVPPWVACYPGYYNTTAECFSLRQIDLCPTKDYSDEPCFPPKQKILAGVFFMQSLNMHGGQDTKDLLVVPFRSVFTMISDMVHGIILITLTLLLTLRSVRSFDATLHFPIYLCIVGTMIISVLALTQAGTVFALGKMRQFFSLRSLLNLDSWALSFRRLIVCLRFSEGGLILLGCFMPPNEISPYRSIQLVVAFVITMLLFRFCNVIFSGLLEFRLNLTLKELHLQSGESIIFIVYPLILGLQKFGHLFCFIYFLILTILSFYSQALKLIILEKTISYHFNIASYYAYMRTFICTMGYLGALIISLVSYENYFYLFKNCIKLFMVGILCIQLIIVHLYGSQRFSDDIEFFCHIKVATYFKFSLIVTPFMCLVDFDHWRNYSRGNKIFVLMFLVAVSVVPAVIALFYIIAVYAKKKNLIGLLRPMDQFGHPDIQMRIYRILYTPRLTVKYKRQKEICTHDCIQHSPAVEMAVQEETDLMKKLIIELENSGEGAEDNTDLVSELKKDLEILSKRPKRPN